MADDARTEARRRIANALRPIFTAHGSTSAVFEMGADAVLDLFPTVNWMPAFSATTGAAWCCTARWSRSPRSPPMPDLRKRIMHWMWDGRPRWTWWLSDHWPLDRWLSLDDTVGRVLCAFRGHEPICDQCHKPDHDFCSWCRKSMPGQAHRKEPTDEVR